MKYFSNATLARCTHLPCFAQVTLRGGICGMATNAAPLSPMSARHTAFQVASAVAGLPSMAALMLAASAPTMDSIMKPVLGAPVGTAVTSTGGIATHTPAEKMFGNAGLRWCLSISTKPRGLTSPSTPRTAATPVNAGITIE